MKRKCIAILSLIIIITSSLLGSSQVMATTTEEANGEAWPSGPSINAESAIVMEASTGLVLYEKNIDEKRYPASITKIMTVLLALENSSLGDTITFSENAVYGVEAGSSALITDVGEQITMQQALYSILLISANDSAVAVAEHVAGDVDSFVKLMNEKAKSLGCKNTHFVNPHGLPDDNHYTTAYDMALITRAAMENETFRKIFNTRAYQIPPTNKQSETRYLSNHHDFVKSDGYLYEDCIGGKTGYTRVAGYTLVSVAKRGDLELICIILKDDSNQHQYTDTQELFDYAFDNFSIYPIADLEDTAALIESPMFTKYNSLLSKSDTPIITDEDGYLVLPNTASFEDAQKEVSFYSASDRNSEAATSDSKTGSDTSEAPDSETSKKVIGKISYTYDGKYVGGADILYNSTDAPVLIKSKADTNNPIISPNTSTTKMHISLSMIIIGCIIGLIVLGIVLYFILIERPRLKRRNAYYKKKAHRKSYKNDDFYNL